MLIQCIYNIQRKLNFILKLFLALNKSFMHIIFQVFSPVTEMSIFALLVIACITFPLLSEILEYILLSLYYDF